MKEFKLKARKVQLLGKTWNDVDFFACLEEKNLFVKVDRSSEKFLYKKIKCLSNGCTDFIVQSDGLKITMNRHAMFEEGLKAAMNGTVLGGTTQQQGNKQANSSSSTQTAARPQNHNARDVNKIGVSSRGAVLSCSVSSVVTRNVMSPGLSLSSPPTTSPPSQPLQRSNDGFSGTQGNSIARAFRPATFSVGTVSNVSDSRTSKTEHGLPSTTNNRGNLKEEAVTAKTSKSANDSGWLDDECLDLSSSSGPNDAQKPPPIVRVYSHKKPNNVLEYLRGQTPDPARKNLFGAYSSSSAQKIESGNKMERVSESPPYSRVYSATSAVNTVSRLGKLDLVVHSSSKKQSAPSSPEPAWLAEDKKEGAVERPAARPASNFFASFRQVHANVGSHIQSGTDGSASGSKRLPGGIRNLGNSCYIGSILQALLSMEDFHQVLLSPFWTTLLEQQQQSHQQQQSQLQSQPYLQAGAGSVVIAAPSSPASTTLPTDGSELDILVDDNSKNKATLAGDFYTVDTASAEEVPVKDGTNVLEKYQVHSVLTELRKLFLQKAALSSSSTSSVSVGSAVPVTVPAAATVLDVTRLKRSMVHHTKKFAGYSQQDAQEFLSDLLDALQSEMQDRFSAFAEFIAGTNATTSPVGDNEVKKSVQPFGTPGPSSSYHSKEVGGDGETDDVVVGTKRTWLDAEALNQVTAKKNKNRVSDFDVTEPSGMYGAADIVYSVPSTQEGGTVLKTPTADIRSDNPIGCCPPHISPCSELMQSTLRVDIQCLQCGHARDAIHEQYQHFPLDLIQKVTDTGAGRGEARELKELLGSFFADEIRDLTCELCGEPDSGMSGTASIHSSIAELPPVLVLQLKRFEYDMQLQKMTKVCADVDFPSSLDLSVFCAPASATNAGMRDGRSLWLGKKDIWDMSTSALLRDPSAFTALCNKITTASTEEASVVGSAVYDLTGVVRHIGRTEGAGHYICDVKLSAQERNSAGEGAKEWRRYDDSLVTALDQSSVMEERDTPYLFFYTKR